MEKAIQRDYKVAWNAFELAESFWEIYTCLAGFQKQSAPLAKNDWKLLSDFGHILIGWQIIFFQIIIESDLQRQK